MDRVVGQDAHIATVRSERDRVVLRDAAECREWPRSRRRAAVHGGPQVPAEMQMPRRRAHGRNVGPWQIAVARRDRPRKLLTLSRIAVEDEQAVAGGRACPLDQGMLPRRRPRQRAGPCSAVRQLGPDTHAPGVPFTGSDARAGSGDGVSMAARSFVACAATWRAVSPPSAARCAMSDSLSRRPPFPQRRHPSATPPARPSDAQQQSRPAPDTGHGPWYARPTRRQSGRLCSAASRSGQCVTPHPSRPRSVGRSDAFSGEASLLQVKNHPFGAPAYCD